VAEPSPVTGDDHRPARPVFISYATEDRKNALAICEAIEGCGAKCWIACRDVQPGENYQEAIVHAIRGARALVLVFTEAANGSDEIKKELSLVSRFHIPVMVLRTEDIEPTDAFAYELSTRQWINLFEGWDKSIDALAARLNQLATGDAAALPPIPAPRARGVGVRSTPWRGLTVAAVLAVLIILVGAAWLLLRPTAVAAHTMQVRLADFERLSPDLPATMPDALRDEIVAAFSDDGVVRMSTASAPPPGSAPAYALGGTLRRDGAHVRVITRLTNERSGATLWTYSYNYDAEQLAGIPRWVAVEAGKIVRCGLFAASTYRKSLPDGVIADYMQFCQNTDGSNPQRGKALLFARKVVSATPDFSWGWSAVEIATRWVYWEKFGTGEAQQLRAQALQAADRAIELDPTNSEALSEKTFLIPLDQIEQEKLLKQALSARPLDCACEHYIYAIMLQNVGRYADSINQLRQSADALALNPDPQIGLADALIAVGKPDEAKPHIDAAADLVPDPTFVSGFTISEATTTGDYAAGIRALNDPKFQMPTPLRTAALAGFQAMATGDGQAKTRAVGLLIALPADQKGYLAAKLLARLGANREALQVIEKAAAAGRFDAPSWLFYPEMGGVLRDPAFPAIAARLGLMKYWRTTKKMPDFCLAKDPPPACRMI
jgi:tetratricopeptide (TPR) repeat protein